MLTILWFIAPTVNFEYQAYSVDEFDGEAMLILTLSNPPSTAVTIEIFSTDGSATGNHVQYQIPYYYNIFFDN